MGKLALVIEDYPAINKLICRVLEDLGYQTLKAESGKEAHLLLQNMQFDLITMDLILGDMHGNELLDLLYRQASATPIIIITASPQELKRVPQVKKVILKPFRITELINGLSNLEQ